jgi:ESCRT-II complex subunit VPS22
MLRAIKKLRVLGSGFAVIPVGGRRLVQSVPGELSMDHTTILQSAEVPYHCNDLLDLLNGYFVQSSGYISHSDLVQETGWETARASQALVGIVSSLVSLIYTYGGTCVTGTSCS